MDNVSRRSIFADVVRGAGSQLAASPRAQGTLYLDGFGVVPPMVIDNSKGRMWNAVKDAAGVATGVMEARDADNRLLAQNAALEEAMAGEGMTPQKLVKLRQLGVDVDTLKMAFPQEDRLGKNQMIQYGRDVAGMQAINAVQPGTFSDEQIAQAGAAATAAHEQELREKMQLAAAGRSPAAPRSMSDMERYLNATPDERLVMDQFRSKGKAAAGGGLTVNEDGTVSYSDPSSSMSNQDRKFAFESQENADKAAVQSESIGRITGRLSSMATNPDVKDKIAQVAANNDFNSIAEILRTPNAFANSSEVIGLAIGDARALAPVSNTDFDKLLARYPSALTDPAVAGSFFEELDRQSRGAFERNSNKATFHNLRADGLIPIGMTESAFKSKLSKPPADSPDADIWDGLTPDERYEQYRQYGGLR